MNRALKSGRRRFRWRATTRKPESLSCVLARNSWPNMGVAWPLVKPPKAAQIGLYKLLMSTVMPGAASQRDLVRTRGGAASAERVARRVGRCSQRELRHDARL